MPQDALKLAHKYIGRKPMPASLKKAFERNGLVQLLPGVYQRTAQLIEEQRHEPSAKMAHLEQILPCIAFYEALLAHTGDREKALAQFGSWCFEKIEQMAAIIPPVMKIPGLYRLIPPLMNKMLYSVFGREAGFDYVEKEQPNGFAVDMTRCPYVETCRQQGCPELAQFFCKSDDICYGNMHPRLVWGRTQTLGSGGEVCDFKMWIREK
ncbi:MAG: L-2-amino-thiazoline-4-carboxylic acid hydrolase [Clostridia bacterium]|nr:L-2-amino-thiazoline-4-carboxylic acid hydrolase [Clostridia bacterium]